MKTDIEVLSLQNVTIDDLHELEYQGEPAFGDNHWGCLFGSTAEALKRLAAQLDAHSRMRAIRLRDEAAIMADRDALTWTDRNGCTLCEPGTQAAIDMILDRIEQLSNAPARFLTGYREAEAAGYDEEECLDAANDAVYNEPAAA